MGVRHWTGHRAGWVSEGDPTGRLTPAAGYARRAREASHTSTGSTDPELLTDDSAGASSPGGGANDPAELTSSERLRGPQSEMSQRYLMEEDAGMEEKI